MRLGYGQDIEKDADFNCEWICRQCVCDTIHGIYITESYVIIIWVVKEEGDKCDLETVGKVLLSCCLLNCKVILLYAQNSQAFWVNILNYELALFCLQWKVSNQTLTRYRFLWKIHYLHVGTGLGNETGKSQNIKKKSTHEFFICLAINEKHMNSHFVLCQFENLCFEINTLRMASVSDFSQTPL